MSEIQECWSSLCTNRKGPDRRKLFARLPATPGTSFLLAKASPNVLSPHPGFKNLKVIVSFNGFQQTFEMKISKPAELKEYTINLAGGFVGMLGSVVIVKKPADHHLLKLVAENCNLNITSAKDLALLENLANPKKSKKAMQADLALLFSPLSALSNPLLTRLASGPQQDHFSDLVNAKRKIEALGETFSWFKSRQTVDLNRLGGYNAFIMLLSIISSPYSSS